jgi:outer membrane protein OmpA-like peptidoglycan-associated protein
MFKRTLLIILLGASIGASAQLSLPTFEVGAGLALRHTEGFYIPRYSLAGHKIFKGLGLYLSYEQRNNVQFSDDFNADGNYQRYLVGPTLYVNPNIYLYGGISPLGPYGLGGDGGFGKVRKEIGFAYVFKPFTLHAGYSNWVGFTTGVGYQFGGASVADMSFQSKSRRPKPASSGMAKKTESLRVDTVFITKEVIKEVIKEVPMESVIEVTKEVVLESALTLLFNLNSTEYSSATAVKVESELAALRVKYPNSKLLIVGNTDESGSATYNYNLGLMRAQKVANYLMSKTGLGEENIIIRSDGKVRPLSGDDKDQNRRVDVYIMLDK